MLKIKNIFSKFTNIPHLFGKVVVLWCITFGTCASALALRILSHTGHDPAVLLGVILGFFGGELLILCLKTILKRENASNSDAEGGKYRE